MKVTVELKDLINAKILQIESDGYGTLILTTDKGTFEVVTFVDDCTILVYQIKNLSSEVTKK